MRERLLLVARRLLWGLVGVAVLALVGVATIVWPAVRDELFVQRLVRTVALDWRDFGEDKARMRLAMELAAHAAAPEGCALELDDDGLRTVRCHWPVHVGIGSRGVAVPIAASASLGPDGSLR